MYLYVLYGLVCTGEGVPGRFLLRSKAGSPGTHILSVVYAPSEDTHILSVVYAPITAPSEDTMLKP